MRDSDVVACICQAENYVRGVQSEEIVLQVAVHICFHEHLLFSRTIVSLYANICRHNAGQAILSYQRANILSLGNACAANQAYSVMACKIV